MRRDSRAFLMDVVEAADAILDAVNGIDLDENAPRIISFRNKLTHEYVKVDNTLVWGVIKSYLKPLRAVCIALATESGPGAL